MRAVESLRDRLAERRALRIIYDHRCPRHRLKRDPMQPNRATERENRGNAAGAAKHDCEASYHVTNVNALRDLLTLLVWSGAVKPPKTIYERHFWHYDFHQIFFPQNAFLDVQVGGIAV
jgi:hypothetical protein